MSFPTNRGWVCGGVRRNLADAIWRNAYQPANRIGKIYLPLPRFILARLLIEMKWWGQNDYFFTLPKK